MNANSIFLGHGRWQFQKVRWSLVPVPYCFTSGSVQLFLFRLSEHLPWFNTYQEWIGDKEQRAFLACSTSSSVRQRQAALFLRYYVFSHYLGVPPSAIHFEYSKDGKPRILTSSAKEHLFFSQTHTESYTMLALSDAPCGLDLEILRLPSSYPHLCRRGFPTAWADEFNKQDPDSHNQQVLFTRYWTILESLYKIQGNGSLRVFLKALARDGERSEFVCDLNAAGVQFHVGPDHIACLTVTGPLRDVFFYQPSVPLIF